MLKNIKKKISDYSWIEKVILTISLVTIILFVTLTNYHDIVQLLRSHIFWDSLFDGSIAHFYDNFTSSNMHNCNLLSRLPLLLWYCPSWIITKLLGGKEYTTFYHQMWHKLFIIIMYFLCIKSMVEISKSISARKREEAKKYCLFMLLSSPGMILSVFYSGQDEIVYITFFMYALKYYIKGKRKRYYFWVIWSVICCPLMLLPYLIITIIDDKKIYSIIGKLLLPLIPQWLYEIYFSQCLTYRYTTSGDFIGLYFTTNNINLGHGKVSVLAVVLILLFVFAYLYRPDFKDVREKIKTFLYIIILLFGALVMIGWDQFYRNFLWVPFAILLVVSFEDLISSKICFAIMIVADIVQNVRVMYDINLVNFSEESRLTVLAHKIFGNIKYWKYPLFLNKTGLEIIFLNSLMVACLILFAYFGRKKTCDRLELQLQPSLLMALYSLVLPLLLVYSLIRAFLIS